jgi:alkanesulfonate monooxygenase SsuD/methylene tetrahydromethanopterin reductase-like flavin-dependent oxidoreductase (luciferase family)
MFTPYTVDRLEAFQTKVKQIMTQFLTNPYSTPAISIVASPTKRNVILELAQQAEQLGFAGLACPSLGGTMALCTSLAHSTNTIHFWTSIQPMYYSHPVETANTAAHIHEISGGRFGLGIGVSHGPVVERLGVETGKPLSDITHYVAAMRANERFSGALPPIYLATLRDKMLALSHQISEGAIWANASLRDIGRQVASIPDVKQSSFFISNMVPTIITDDIKSALALHRKTLTGYVSLPNYRNYWRDAGYVDEMNAIENVLVSTPKELMAETLQATMSDTWLQDCTISGNKSQVREQFAAWADSGVLPIAVMSSTSGGQVKAINELLGLFN